MNQPQRKPLLGCIADDFTGATDLANNLVRAGMRTVQIIGVPEDEAAAVEADAIVVALKSRTIAPTDAVAQSLAALRWLRAQGVQQVYFKYCSTFDSTPEGNIGPVTDALLDALSDLPQSGFTIACPAFPENQRTVFNGHLFVGEQLLSDSGMRNHPLTPMTDANLVRVLQLQTKHKVGLVAHDVVAKGAHAIRERFAVLQAEGIRIAVVDAVSNADLMHLGAALQGMPLVTAGSGVAIGLPQNWPSIERRAAVARADTLPPAAGLRAVVSGSCSQATNAQVLHFKRSGRPSFAVDPLAIAAGDDLVGEALAWAARHVSDGPVLVYATAESAAVKDVQAQLGVARAGEMVEQALSNIALGLVERGVRQLVVAGGETSGAVVRELNVRQMSIGPQIDPGVPWTAVQSPACAGETLHVALKSGNFGTADFFTKAFDRLEAA
ncbi:four-carbon acid sugar kinase family protein [Variovorax sp. J22G21]|uniref:3-oxo-tetronate kinase n=1 Tax=Variovorax fucosicus TaxID=3053517 RepID=UPI002577E353|nr:MULTISPECIES: 3-oxo-tetronate kinase [unclassified Variovorax]MDM0041204.1 four-carbon acid sugar kinase family protein [Variovorax sp. J22R193]MDM0057611.1 four-carbon acid sugar kinase family protein [Variovorax sp. J22G47]MDM0060261.1 four-carbon acid sugar kinase family protein [Variovorax sp. J22G21]